jgi:hypothetical protein
MTKMRPALPEDGYAAKLRLAMDAVGVREGRTLTIRDLANRANCSYEHARRILLGAPAFSAGLNRRLCAALQLDAGRMWELAVGEKLKQRRHGLRVKGDAPLAVERVEPNTLAASETASQAVPPESVLGGSPGPQGPKPRRILRFEVLVYEIADVA